MAVNIAYEDAGAPGTWATATLGAAGDSVILTASDPGAVSPEKAVSWHYTPAAGGSAAVAVTLARDPQAADWFDHVDHADIQAAGAADVETAPFAHMRWTAAGAGGTLRVMTGAGVGLADGA